MPNFSLFDDFSEVSAKEWKQKIAIDLKGADYDKSLIWQSSEGVDVQPFYHGEHSVSHVIRKKEGSWFVGQLIEVETAKNANLKALESIKNGAERIWFVVASKRVELAVLVKSIDLDAIEIHIDFQEMSTIIMGSILEFIKTYKTIHIHFDSIGQLAKSGNWFENEKADFDRYNSLTAHKLKTISVDATLYQNAGATMIQQLAYALAHGNEYLNHSNKPGRKMTFKVAVGANYFFEIAKIRALRLLWATLALEYGLNEDCFILATPSKRNKTLYDYNVNMLRTSTECMAAVLGGADLICNLPYDAIYHEPNVFGDRIALNQLLLLKNESYFDKIDNAAEGAYYIESLTQELAEKALELFKEIEVLGGFLEQLKVGSIQGAIKKSAVLEQNKFDNNDVVLIGTNKYQNTSDKMKDAVQINPFCSTDFGETLIEPIVEKRLAEEIEQKRLDDE